MTRNLTSFVLLIFFAGDAVNASDTQTAYKQCILQEIELADGNVAVRVIRERCRARRDGDVDSETLETVPLPSAIDRRLADEQANQYSGFSLTPHRPNYLILSHNTRGYDSSLFRQQTGMPLDFDDTEVQFQVSIKYPLFDNLFGDNGDLFIAYTNRSFWQGFNDDISEAFRETNHEPEAWLQFDTDWRFWGFKNSLFNIGLSHQSNGRSGILSRSWNRLYAQFILERENFYFAFKPWYRIPEQDEDDNPDIEDFLGNFELVGVYKWRRQTFGLLLRNNLDFDDNHGALRFDWSFPLHKHLRGYLQWFNGYGESLIDYDRRVNSIGVGVSLSDYL